MPTVPDHGVPEKRSKIYEQANDLHVVARVVYASSAHQYAYADADFTTKINALTLVDMFTKGMIIVDGAEKYKPVSVAVTSGVATVTYVKADATTATTAVLATLVSEEFHQAGD